MTPISQIGGFGSKHAVLLAIGLLRASKYLENNAQLPYRPHSVICEICVICG